MLYPLHYDVEDHITRKLKQNADERHNHGHTPHCLPVLILVLHLSNT